MAKKKRERKKKCRRKCILSTEILKQLDAESKKEWLIPEVHTLLNKKSVSLVTPTQFELLAKGSKHEFLKAFLSKQCYDLLKSLDAIIFENFLHISEKILKNFRRLRLGRILNDHVPSCSQFSNVKMIESYLTPKQLYAILFKLLHLILPEELFSVGMRKIVCHNFTQIFCRLRSRGVIASFSEAFCNVRIDSFLCNKKMPFKLKMMCAQNSINFLVNLIANFFSKYFYSTMNYAGQIVHYRRIVWSKIERYGFAMLKAQRMLSPVLRHAINLVENPIHRLRFVPKRTSVRPIVSFKNEQVSQALSEVCAILDLIIAENPAILGWGITNLRIFNFAYRNLMLGHKKTIKRKESANKFWCTLDLANCFTTIDHKFLENILVKLISKDRKFTVIRVTVASNNVKTRRFQRRVAGNGFAHALSRIFIKGNSEFICTNPVHFVLTGAEVLQRIKQFVLQTVIGRSNVLYRCGRGIAQGNPVSVKLCNIYLGTIERILFRERPKDVFCRRYIDDYLMVSTERKKLLKIVKKIQTEGAEFGVQINASKILFSFRNNEILEAQQLKSKRKLTWCGFAFNTKNLAMTIDYRRYRKCRPQYTITAKLHPTMYFKFICATTKRLLMPRFMALRSCARVLSSSQRKELRDGFCKFAYNYYFMHFAHQFNLNLRNKNVRNFFAQLVRWIGNSFSQRAAPDALCNAVEGI